jgi:hypothetical protein
MKNRMLIILSTIFLWTLPHNKAFAQLVFGDFIYEVVDQQVTILSYTNQSAQFATIPSTINSIPVTSIGESAFYKCESLETLIIPEGVTSIGDTAFSECKKLKNINIPSSVKIILNNAFYNCSIESITLPKNAEIIGTVFFNCNKLTKVIVEEDVNLDGGVFWDCRVLSSVIFRGDAPPENFNLFRNNNPIVYYNPEKYGWGSTYSYRQTSPLIPISVTSQPASVSVTPGASASFSVSAAGTSPSYQWYKDGNAISGATGASHTISNAQASDAGSYSVLVSNLGGEVASNAATLTVNSAPPPPVITAQPESITAITGSSARFSVTATGENLTYQWNKNGGLIKGATGSSFSISSVKASDAGYYSVAVKNSAKSVTSAVAKLTVNAPKITSNLSAVTLKRGRSMTRYTVTTNFGAKSFSAKSLPAGLKLNSTTGVVSGTPTKKGTFTVTFTAAKKQGTKVVQSATGKKVFKVN